MKLHYVLLAPWIIYSVSSIPASGFQSALAVSTILFGLSGTFLRLKRLVEAASLGLLTLLIGGKIVADIVKSGGPDTAVFLSQFVATLLLMEMCFSIADYERDAAKFLVRSDEDSIEILKRVERWLSHQLYADAKLGLASFLMSLGLLVVGSVVSVEVGQLALLAVFVLTAVIALLFLLTYQREPDRLSKPFEK